ncbi:MAG TPA: class I SAM-dependent methyltransferase [Desulfobacteraceae bacterium]|nr:class I SAM-dependent methyltransferase [Desulfobacteraceae bacterium]
MNERETLRSFDERAEQYDAWYDNNPAFAVELAALRASTMVLPRPRLEIGVGSGRFARALQVEFGLDGAFSPLLIAARRRIMSVNGMASHLPFRSQAIGTIYLLFTLCFLAEPGLVLGECSRILLPAGRLLIGMIPAGSAWGKRAAERAREKDSFYRHAHIRSIDETVRLLEANGFAVRESWSTLLQPPGRDIVPEEPIRGALEDAGFCVLISGREERKQCADPT